MTSSNRRLSGSARNWLARVFLVIGIAGVSTWALWMGGSALYQRWAERQLERQQQSQPAAPARKRRVPEGALLGRIEIPRLHVTSVVREGVGAMTLSVAVGHIPGTALPGQTGNMAIAGHRDSFFRGLRGIEKNDVIRVDTPRGSYTYRVEGTEIVDPQDVAVLQPSPSPELTLVTCYPFYYVGSAPERFIVKAREVTQGSDSTSASQKVANQALYARNPWRTRVPPSHAW